MCHFPFSCHSCTCQHSYSMHQILAGEVKEEIFGLQPGIPGEPCKIWACHWLCSTILGSYSIRKSSQGRHSIQCKGKFKPLFLFCKWRYDARSTETSNTLDYSVNTYSKFFPLKLVRICSKCSIKSMYSSYTVTYFRAYFWWTRRSWLESNLAEHAWGLWSITYTNERLNLPSPESSFHLAGCTDVTWHGEFSGCPALRTRRWDQEGSDERGQSWGVSYQ